MATRKTSTGKAPARKAAARKTPARKTTAAAPKAPKAPNAEIAAQHASSIKAARAVRSEQTTRRIELYVHAYLANGYQQRAAALRAWPELSPEAASVTASALMKRPDVRARIAQLQKRQLDILGITAERVKLELARIAFADARDLYDTEGNALPVDLLPTDIAATIVGVEHDVSETVEHSGDGAEVSRRTRTVNVKIRRADKVAALRVLAQHFKIVGPDADDLAGVALAIADRMEAARERVRKLRGKGALPPPG